MRSHHTVVESATPCQIADLRHRFVTTVRPLLQFSKEVRGYANCPDVEGGQSVAMPKHAITIPSRRVGRRVRWMLEVSADVGEGVVHAKKSRKRTRAKRTNKPSRARSSQRPPAVRVGLAPTSGRTQMSPSASKTTTQEMVFMAVVGAVVVGAVALTAYPSLRVAFGAPTAQPQTVAQPVHAAAPARPAPPVAAVATTSVPRTSVEKPSQAPVMSTRSSPAVPFRWPPPGMKSDTAAPRVSSETDALGRTLDAPAVAATTTANAASPAVTISGCLEMAVDEEEFRLTETEGADAPKSRGWRSGFLTKRSAPVELTDLSDTAGLRKYVGLRVAVTGVLTDRKLRVRSFQAAGTSCN
jgi:hypothetical protein